MPTPEEVKQYGLKAGEYIRLYSTGPVYKVETVNKSRAYCIPLKKQLVKVQALDPESGVAIDREFDKSKDGGISIAVMSLVTKITEEEALASVDTVNQRQPVKKREDTTMGASAIPVAGSGKSAREREKDRRSAQASKRQGRAATIPGTRKVARSAKEKAPRTVRKCFCGCGEETMSYFVPGHDARFHGWLRKIAKGEMKPEDLKKAIRDVIGPFKKKGEGYVPSKSYKGEPYVAH